MLKHIHYICLVMLGAELSTYAVDDKNPKVVWGVAVNDGGQGHCIGKKQDALCDLLHAVTGNNYKDCIDICKDVKKTTQLLIEKTGMHIEDEAVLIPLNISDPRELKLKSYSDSWDHYSFMSEQLFDEERQVHIVIPRYWPYAWFVDALDGNVVEIPLSGGRFVARLYLEPPKGFAMPFHIHAARIVAACMGVSIERTGEIIKERYGIEIDGL